MNEPYFRFALLTILSTAVMLPPYGAAEPAVMKVEPAASSKQAVSSLGVQKNIVDISGNKSEQTARGNLDASLPAPAPARSGVTTANDARTNHAAGVSTQAGEVMHSEIEVKSNLPPQYHKVQMRLSGSMCYSCLLTMQDRLRKLPGVHDALVERPPLGIYQPSAPEIINWAPCTVSYDANAISLSTLKLFLRQNGYAPFKTVDKAVNDPTLATKKDKGK